jgi:hypothetical protein
MPHVLIAGTVSAAPKSTPFPDQGRPYASVVIDADGDNRARFRDGRSRMPAPGDSVSIQGTLVLVNQKGKLAGIYVVARQVNPLRQRSRNRLPARDAHL